MPKSFNPFDDWLGLGPNVVNPHHFQLLGVDPSLTDPGQIKSAVEKGVKRNLARLGKVPAGSHDQVVEKLKRRILSAQMTLLDAEQRQLYLDRIKSNAITGQSKRSNVKQAKPTSGVPIAKPIRQNAALGPVAKVKPSASSAVDIRTDVNDGEFSIKTATRRKKRRPVVPIALGVFVLIASGLAILAYNQTESIRRLVGIGQPQSVAEGRGVALPEPALDQRQEDSSETESDKRVPSISDPNQAVVDRSNSDAASGIPSQINSQQKEDTPHVELSASELGLIRRLIERAYRSLERNDTEMARAEATNAADLLDLRLRNGVLKPGQQDKLLEEVIQSTQAVADMLDEFWSQVIKSCQQIPGGQEIIVNRQILAFVEATPNHVLIRSSGTNISYPYFSLPSELSIVLANQGGIDDIALWSIYQAAFLAVNPQETDEHRDRIEGLLTAAEAFGHDCSAIRFFIDFHPDSIIEPSMHPDLSTSQHEQMIKGFREEHSYESPRAIAPSKARALFEELFHREMKDATRHLAEFNEALQLATQAGDGSRVEDALNELSLHVEIDYPSKASASFGEIASRELDIWQARELLERSLKFLESENGLEASDADKQKLIDQLKQLATQHKMNDLVHRIDQL